MIIGILNQKGGVGKTTIAIGFCRYIGSSTKTRSSRGCRSQGSSLAWSSARELNPLFAVVGMAKPTLHRDLPSVARDYDYVVIDGAPRVNQAAVTLLSWPVILS